MKNIAIVILILTLIVASFPKEVLALRPMAYGTDISNDAIGESLSLDISIRERIISLIKENTSISGIKSDIENTINKAQHKSQHKQQAERDYAVALAKIAVSAESMEKLVSGKRVSQICCQLAQAIGGSVLSIYKSKIDEYEKARFIKKLIRHGDPYYDIEGFFTTLGIVFLFIPQAMPDSVKEFVSIYPPQPKKTSAPNGKFLKYLDGEDEFSFEELKSILEELQKDSVSIKNWLDNLEGMYAGFFTKRIEPKIENMLALVEDIIAILNNELGKEEEVDLVKIVSEINKIFIQKEVLETVIMHTQSPSVIIHKANRRRLFSALYCLFNNAQEAGSDTTEVDISYEGSDAVIRIKDNGSGIKDEALVQGRYPGRPILFDLGYSTKEETGGTGTYGVLRFIEGHGGSIKISSLTKNNIDPQQDRLTPGTTFTIKIPLDRNPDSISVPLSPQDPRRVMHHINAAA